jgi:hypothetical protein
MILLKVFFSKNQNEVILVLEPGWLWSPQYWFLGLRNICSLIDLTSLNSPISLHNFLILMVSTFLATKWPILVLFCEMDHQKSNFSMIFSTLSVGGCWLLRLVRSMRLQMFLRPKNQYWGLQSHPGSRTNITSFWFFEKKTFNRIIKITLNFSTFSVGGCWGQSMLLF